MALVYLHKPHIRALMIVGITLGGSSQSRAGVGEPVTLEVIIRSWNARQGHARTVDFTGRGTQSLPARVVSADEATLPTGPKGEAFSVPASTFNIKVRVVADDTSRFRVECIEKLLDYSQKNYVSQTSLEIVKDNRSIVYLPVSKLEFPIATIQKAKPSDVSTRAAALPILMVYRAQMSGIFGTGNLVLTNEKCAIDGNICIALKCGDNMIWVDPERDFVPTGFRWIVRGVVRQAFDIKYSQDARHGWVPSAWTIVRQDRTGKPAETRNLRVESYRIDTGTDDNNLGIEFDPGTWVNDLTTGETYILRKGGARRIVRRGEYNGHNYKELLEQAPNP